MKPSDIEAEIKRLQEMNADMERRLREQRAMIEELRKALQTSKDRREPAPGDKPKP